MRAAVFASYVGVLFLEEEHAYVASDALARSTHDHVSGWGLGSTMPWRRRVYSARSLLLRGIVLSTVIIIVGTVCLNSHGISETFASRPAYFVDLEMIPRASTHSRAPRKDARVESHYGDNQTSMLSSQISTQSVSLPKDTVPIKAHRNTMERKGRTKVLSPSSRTKHTHSLVNTRVNRSSTTLGFMMAVKVEQQVNAGFMGYTQLAKIAGLLHLSIVEPYVQDTMVRGAPIIAGCENPPLKLSRLYNMSEYRRILNDCCPGSKVVSFEEFLERSSRKILHLSFSTSLKDAHREQLSHARKVVEVDINLSAPVSKGILALNYWANFIARKQNSSFVPFNRYRYVIVDAHPKHPLPLSQITEVLSSIVRKHADEYGSATVILDTWRSIHSDGDSSYFYHILDWNWISRDVIRSITHSDVIVYAARDFAQSMNREHPVIGVHIRGERLLNQPRVESVDHCLSELANLLRNGSVPNATSDKVHMFHDLGKYGTMSCGNGCGDRGVELVTKIRRLGFPISSYEPSNFESLKNITINRAFVSLVEKEYLSRVDVLVTVGWGGFQQSVVERFLKYNGGNSANLHRICFAGNVQI